MIFNKHDELKDKHAFLSPSKGAWLNDSDEKLLDRLDKTMTAALGTRLHALADELIKLGVKLPDTSQTLNMYVNDCIGYRMSTEVPLMVSYNAFGTADAVTFDEETQTLRIYDLKNGFGPTTERQLEIYAAYFCIEYNKNPLQIGYDLRIYQNDDIKEYHINPENIAFIISETLHKDRLVKEFKGGGA